jgi:hypothetical protein
MDVKRMDDDELLAALQGLARDKQRNDAAMLAHLDEAERRRLFAKAGYPSMFEYCVKVLHLSESAAGKRIRVARLARRFPLIVDLVETGELHLSGLCVLGAHLDDDNYRSLLDRARGKTRRQIEGLVAEVAPRPEVAASITKVGGGPKTSPAGQGSLLGTPVGQGGLLGTPAEQGSLLGTPEGQGSLIDTPVGQRSLLDVAHATATSAVGSSGGAPAVAGAAPGVAAAAEAVGKVAEPVSGAGDRCRSEQQAPGPAEQGTFRKPTPRFSTPRPGTVEVLAPERYLVKVTLDAEAKAKLDRARALVSHSVPDGNLAAVIERALDALIEKTEKRRFGKGRTPRKQREPLGEGTRTIPAAVAREVIELDGERCSYTSAHDGQLCGSTWLLQMHHLEAFAKGGPPTVENVAIFCRAHNLYAADVEFGRAFMERRRQRRAGRASGRHRAGGPNAIGTSPASEAGVVWNRPASSLVASARIGDRYRTLALRSPVTFGA